MSIKNLAEVSRKDINSVGGKAASLGELMEESIPVPPGFVITTDAFKEGMTESLKKEILETFDRLGAGRVAVRSSATMEDSTTASWAGQLETYLNTTREDLIEAVKKCWESIGSERAVEYVKKHDIGKDRRAVAVVVQAMVDSDISGVLFTVNPVSQKRDELVIEAIYGLGELLVQGAVTPENLIVDRRGKVISRESSRQHKQLVYKNGANREEGVIPKREVVNGQLLGRLVKVALEVEAHYDNIPQDIEWAVENGKLYIVQSRPVTTISKNGHGSDEI